MPTVDDIVVTLGKDGTVRFVHSAGDFSMTIGESFFNHLKGGEELELRDAISITAATGQPTRIEVQCERTRGGRWLDCRFVPAADRAGAVILIASDCSVRRIAHDRIESLTDEERDVLRRLASGDHHKKIAADLRLGKRTVDRHRASLCRKLQAKTLGDLGRLLAVAGFDPLSES